MRAMVIPRFGGPDVFELREVDRPERGPGQILVRVMASAVNPVDAKLRAAKPMSVSTLITDAEK
jgi:NADPH2:quinone reductase